MAWRRTKEQKT